MIIYANSGTIVVIFKLYERAFSCYSTVVLRSHDDIVIRGAKQNMLIVSQSTLNLIVTSIASIVSSLKSKLERLFI